MHTLSLFPDLLSWNQLAPFLIRLVLGSVFLHWAYVGIRLQGASARAKASASLEGLVGLLLVAGLWTQGAALFAAVRLFAHIIDRIIKKSFLTDGVNYYLILFVMALSLLLTGAGFFGFDYTNL